MAARDAYVLLRLHGVRHGVPTDVAVVEFFETEEEAEQATLRLNTENTDSTVEYSWSIAVAQGNDEYAFGTHVRDPAEDDKPWVPEHNRDQSCAFCEASRPVFAHRLDPDHTQFRVHDKGRTLPTFWAVCARCETLVAARDDSELLALMTWDDDDRSREATLAAFRASDLGSERLGEGPPDTVPR